MPTFLPASVDAAIVGGGPAGCSAARWLAQPIHRLASAAQELGRNLDRPPLPEDGPVECRDASRVFNQMQERLRQQLAQLNTSAQRGHTLAFSVGSAALLPDEDEGPASLVARADAAMYVEKQSKARAA